MSSDPRDPFDETDRAQAMRFLASRQMQLVDPLGDDAAPSDPHFAPSLATARHFFENAFQSVRDDGQRFRAYPAFIERPSANAFAIDLGDLNLCAMDTGVATAVFELSAFAFSQAHLFAEVGNPAVEESPALPGHAQLGYWIADRLFASDHAMPTPIGEELIPVDPERRTMAAFLSQMMMRFVWFHELFHALNGHTGFLTSIREGLALCEMPGDPALPLVEIEKEVTSSIPWATVQHCLEFDADRSAFWTMVRLQRAGDEPFEVLAAQPLPLRLKLVTMAAVLMTFLFDQSARRHAHLTGTTHPSAYLRLQNLVRTLVVNADDPSRKARSILADVLQETDQLRRSVPALFASDRLMADVDSAAFQRDLDQMDAVLGTVRHLLSPFAYR